MMQLLSSRYILLKSSSLRLNSKSYSKKYYIHKTCNINTRSLSTTANNTPSTSAVTSSNKSNGNTNNNNTQSNQKSKQQQQYETHPKLKTYNAISKTLYKQILKWTYVTGTDVPFDSTIPPLTLQPPLIDKQALETLASAVASKKKKENDGKENENDYIHQSLINL